MISKRLHEMLERTKRLSDDPDTQISCVIVTKDGREIWGANRLPIGLYPHDVSLERPEKHDWIEHAERHAIFECALTGTSTYRAKIYLTGFPCVECARAIVNSGISELHCKPAKFYDAGRYKFDKSRRILEAGGVAIYEDYE